MLGDYCDPCDDGLGDYCDPSEDTLGDYCDPCDEEPPTSTKEDDDNIYSDIPEESSNQLLVDDNANAMYQPLVEINTHKKLDGQLSNNYETLEDVKERLDRIPPYQPLTLPRTPSMDEDMYQEI